MTTKHRTVLLPLFTAALSLSALHAPAGATEPFKRKGGLWEIKNSVMGMAGMGGAMQVCVDEKTDDLQRQLSGQDHPQHKSQCTVQDTKRSGDKLTLTSVCQMQGRKVTTKVEMSGSFESAYHGDITATYDPPMGNMKETRMTMDAKWLGPCKAGQKPGDMIMPNGMVVNGKRK